VSASTHELDAPPWRRVDSTIMTTARAIRRAYESRLSPLGLNLTQAGLLAFLKNSGALTQTRLASGLGLGRAAAGSVIDALERRGLVQRKPDSRDRRVWLVAITGAGTDLVGAVERIDKALRSDLRRGISRSERQQLAELLLRLQANLSDILVDGERPRDDWSRPTRA